MKMSKQSPFNDENSNNTANPHFEDVLKTRLSRRRMLGVGASSVAVAAASGLGLTACGGGSGGTVAAPALLGFNAVAKSLADAVVVPSGYKATVIYALGDPLTAATPAFGNTGNDTDFENRAGDHHDGMEWFGLSDSGRPSASATSRGLLAMNHEATTDETKSSFFLHATGGTATLPRPAVEVDKETAIHGVSIVEVKKTGSAWAYVKDSAFNARITCLSEVELSGVAEGHALMVTKYATDGRRGRGTLNNCGTGKTPWGSFLTGEENWAGYFTRSASDDTARGGAAAKSVVSLQRYGRNQGSASRHGWETGGAADKYKRWDISQTGGSTDGSDDYRNELNTMGYIVEMDPYDKTRLPKKRTSMGRFAHESAAFGLPVAGKPLAVYMGDDSRNEYIYKFVSSANWDAADADPLSRMAAGDKYLDSGKLYVAKFNSDGTGQWVELSMSNATVTGYGKYAFEDNADVAVNARLAADAVGATKMDRPEWCAVNPANGEIYYTLTNNSNRKVDATSSSHSVVDSANPRYYSDTKGASTSTGNVNGHILRMKEGAAGSAATTFTWDVYVFGAQSDADASKINLSSLTADQDFSSPDGLVFSPATGVMWIQTDDGAYTDVSNCMMLAALPGQVGDGASKTLSYTKADTSTLNVTTHVGKAPTASTLKRFLVGPKDCEITGLCETPDGKAIFVNIQHPGEGTKMADVTDPTKYTSQWPSNAGYGAGQRPRSATIVITRDDGGKVGT
ncbi:MAG: hypothetical protein RL758_877 [Pseudomonadota bacterium]|jgi:secreted PhoX family phosphatase